jgi:hypothetical protein
VFELPSSPASAIRLPSCGFEKLDFFVKSPSVIEIVSTKICHDKSHDWDLVRGIAFDLIDDKGLNE